MSLLQRLEAKKTTVTGNETGKEKKHSSIDPYEEMKTRLHKSVIDKLKDVPEENKEDNNTLARHIEEIVDETLKEDETSPHIPRGDRQRIAGEIIDEITGFGPITPLLNNADVNEVMVNGPYNVYVEKGGRLIKTDVHFKDNDHVMHVIERIVSPLGRRIDESMPMVDARLPDGSRVNAIIPPLALHGPTITIRKFSQEALCMEDVINFGTLTKQMAQFIEACVKSRLNVIISGGTGSGKTTSLNIISSFVPGSERIVTIEDSAELQLLQEHVLTLESRPPNIEGKGAITIRDLVRNALRMRPDRIVVGEVRSQEALDMLQAMNTGHDGSLTTGHANSPRDMLSRLETMVLMAGMDLPLRAIREQISSAIDLIVHQSRLRDGSRKITHITEVQGMESDVIVLQDLFRFHQHGVNSDGSVSGDFQSTGIRPKFIDQLETAGFSLPTDIFQSSIF
ncbi:MAG: CpaF family protein [Clostridiales bacterium]|nr:CpaF family protein [Clostridiales bacterium]MCF8023054.1 CpaF family protein [Clostridiales bacterium]